MEFLEIIQEKKKKAMKIINNLLVVTAGIAVLLVSFVVDKIENTLDDSVLGLVIDGFMIAALFFGIMRLLQWAVWVM